MNENYKEQLEKIIAVTKARMESVGTYMPEFDASIDRYADLSLQYKMISEEWFSDGCKLTEEYTNKAGATNRRKTPVYLAMETIRKELTEMENILGLTPKGLRQIRSKGLEGKKESALGQALKELDGET